MRRLLFGAALAIAAGTSGCAQLLPAGKQAPFEVMNVQAERPPPGPDKVVLTPSNIAIIDKIQFEVGKADLKPISHVVIDEVVGVMKANAQIELVQVQGHTDTDGSAELNRKLSQARSESVVKYMVGKGIKSGRLEGKGFGPDVPIADNAIPEGREANRRVEFLIVKQGPKKTVVKDD